VGANIKSAAAVEEDPVAVSEELVDVTEQYASVVLSGRHALVVSATRSWWSRPVLVWLVFAIVAVPFIIVVILVTVNAVQHVCSCSFFFIFVFRRPKASSSVNISARCPHVSFVLFF
jgi:hypothetical protein